MSRQHPWREQHPDAVRVDRATKWGNPFDVDEHGRAGAIAQYRAALLAGELPGVGKQPGVTVTDVRRELAMRTLACWCPPDSACHADVLAAVAAGEDGPPRRGRAPVELPTNLQDRLNRYADQLGKATMLAAHTRRAYTSQVRGYLAWLDGADVWDGADTCSPSTTATQRTSNQKWPGSASGWPTRRTSPAATSPHWAATSRACSPNASCPSSPC